MYKSESSLVRQFVQRLERPDSPWGSLQTSQEFEFSRGRTDVVALVGGGSHLIAFEAKLEKWRVALQQAYRNTCFAHSSYVVLPRHVALRAEKHFQDFRYRNVGICYIDGGVISILVASEKREPLQPWILSAAVAAVRSRNGQNGRTRTRRSPDMRKARHAIRGTSR